MQKLSALSGVVLLPILLGADTVTLDKATPNPDGKPQLLMGEGKVPEQGFVVGIAFFAKGPGEQVTATVATLDPKEHTWRATLRLGPGQYDCWAVLVKLNLLTRQASTEESEAKNVIVK